MSRTDQSTPPQLSHWISAARLRTLPLALAVIALGTGLSARLHPESFDWRVFVLALFTAFSYQVLSNYANDLGDGIRGTDNHKKGEKRAVASGLISIDQMRKAVLLFTVLSIVSGTALSFLAFSDRIWLFVLFSIMGLLATWAARSYTMGANPYAYWGGGDLFVFLFFGLLGVVGSASLYGVPSVHFVWPAIVAGALSAAVLTLNNLRDEEGDRTAGKRTLVVRFGPSWGRNYFKALVLLSNVSNLIFAFVAAMIWQSQGPVAVHLALIIGLRLMTKKFVSAQKPEQLDALLKPMALLTLAYCVLMAISFQF